MKRIVAIHQSNFLPWFGFLEKYLVSDVWVWLDDAQFVERDYHHRSQFVNPNGEKTWMTYTVDRLGESRFFPLNQNRVNIDSVRRLMDRLKSWHPQGSEYVDRIFPENLLQKACSSSFSCFEFNLSVFKLLIEALREKAGVHPMTLIPSCWRSSELGIISRKGDRILDICKHSLVRAGVYYSGSGARDYLLPMLSQFEEASMSVEFQSFSSHPIWPQTSVEFQRGCSSLEFLLANGDPVSLKAFFEHCQELKSRLQNAI